MAVPCGKAVKGRVYVRGSRDWPKEEGSFYYITKDGQTRYGKQRMMYGLPTTDDKHEVNMYYPIRGTNEAARITSIERHEDGDDTATVIVLYFGSSKYFFPREETYPLSSLELVMEYTSEMGDPRTQSTSKIPNISNTPLNKGSPCKKRSPLRENGTTAIAVSTRVNDVYNLLLGLSSHDKQPVVLAMTHDEVPKEWLQLRLRQFSNMEAIQRLFYKQGIMDEGNQGLSCGVEAVNNAGFTVVASAFSQRAAHGVDVGSFIVSEGERDRNHDGDDYINSTGGGNNIPPHQMFLTLKSLVEQQGLQMDSTPWHRIPELIRTPEFWVGHQWAIVLIPACGGHWVSMEKIIYNGQAAICLREGRGKVTYDFVTSSDGVRRGYLSTDVTGKAIATGGKRKR